MWIWGHKPSSLLPLWSGNVVKVWELEKREAFFGQMANVFLQIKGYPWQVVDKYPGPMSSKTVRQEVIAASSSSFYWVD